MRGSVRGCSGLALKLVNKRFEACNPLLETKLFFHVDSNLRSGMKNEESLTGPG